MGLIYTYIHVHVHEYGCVNESRIYLHMHGYGCVNGSHTQMHMHGYGSIQLVMLIYKEAFGWHSLEVPFALESAERAIEVSPDNEHEHRSSSRKDGAKHVFSLLSLQHRSLQDHVVGGFLAIFLF